MNYQSSCTLAKVGLHKDFLATIITKDIQQINAMRIASVAGIVRSFVNHGPGQYKKDKISFHGNFVFHNLIQPCTIASTKAFFPEIIEAMLVQALDHQKDDVDTTTEIQLRGWINASYNNEVDYQYSYQPFELEGDAKALVEMAEDLSKNALGSNLSEKPPLT